MNEIKTMRDFDSKDSYIGYLEGRILAYEEIIAKSNFRSIVISERPASRYSEEDKKPYSKPYKSKPNKSFKPVKGSFDNGAEENE